MHLAIKVTLATLILFSFGGCAQPRVELADPLPQEEPLELRQEVTFKTVGDVELALHIFNPPDHRASDQKPAIVFFFGGGWNGGSPSHFFNQSQYLASRGMVSVCAEYRVKSRNQTSPKECVMDGKSAVRWLRSHCEELGIDPNRVAAGGGSAGGHVAAATATADGFEEPGEDRSVSCRPDALVLFNPVIDNGPKGYGYDRVSEYWQAFSPMHNLSASTPPTIFFLGTKDPLIPVATAEEYQKRMEDVGGRCDLFLYEGQGHGFFNKSKYSETVMEMDRFLTSVGFLEGEPTLGTKIESRNDLPSIE
jgi:acetyl esterase